jgi:hypothetical protein
MIYFVYKGQYAVLFEPNWEGGIAVSFDHPYDVVGFLGLEDSDSRETETRLRIKANFTQLSRSEISDLSTFFNMIKGRFYTIWMPSFQPDIKVIYPFIAIETYLNIEETQYSAYWMSSSVVGRHILIEWPDGSYVARKIISEPNGNTIGLDAAVGKACSWAELPYLNISFLYFVRLDQDEISMVYETPEIADCELNFITISEEAPV